jgi:hypothetical protein
MAKNLVDMLKRLMFNKMGDKLSENWDFVERFGLHDSLRYHFFQNDHASQNFVIPIP